MVFVDGDVLRVLAVARDRDPDLARPGRARPSIVRRLRLRRTGPPGPPRSCCRCPRSCTRREPTRRRRRRPEVACERQVHARASMCSKPRLEDGRSAESAVWVATESTRPSLQISFDTRASARPSSDSSPVSRPFASACARSSVARAAAHRRRRARLRRAHSSMAERVRVAAPRESSVSPWSGIRRASSVRPWRECSRPR